jgi:SMODS and SLOG-associating 2TM effector domain 1
MGNNTFDTLEKRRQEALSNANKRAYYHEWWYKFLQRTIIVLSTGTALFTGLANFNDWPGWKVIAFVLSTITAGLLAFLSTFKHQEKAEYYDKLSRELDNIRSLYDLGSGPFAKAKSTEDKMKIYAEELNKLLSRPQSHVWL